MEHSCGPDPGLELFPVVCPNCIDLYRFVSQLCSCVPIVGQAATIGCWGHFPSSMRRGTREGTATDLLHPATGEGGSGGRRRPGLGKLELNRVRVKVKVQHL